MKVLITGAAGMLGVKLTQHLTTNCSLCGEDLESITLFDVVAASPPTTECPITVSIGDLRDQTIVKSLIVPRPDVIFHLAAIVSGEAEQDFDKGYGINLDGTRNLIDAIRLEGYVPRLVAASSIAVFGAPFPEAIPDDFFCTPLTSYGTQKAIGELLISDYSRRGLLDGISLRLPTICVRPGKPNKAASGFFSNIIREPLAGKEAALPVSDDVLHWHASPRAAIGFLMRAAEIDTEEVGTRRAVTMPGLAVTVGEQIEALRRVAGADVVARIRREPDEFIQHMVGGWPRKFDAARGLELGFQADESFEKIIRFHLEDEATSI